MRDKIFSSNEDYTATTFLNWRVAKHEDTGNMLVLADGFISSAIQLCQDCLNDNEDKKGDILIFPILHNANHGIELYLKSKVWTLNKLIRSENKIEGKHNIQQIFSTVKAEIKTYKGKEWAKYFDKQNKGLQEYISELFNLISGFGISDNMDFSSYPITVKYENHFYIDRLDNVKIDLEFLNQVRQIFSIWL
jgi:hypothetical protein